MRFADAVAALDARTNYERSGRLPSPTLDRMRALMDVMAEPQRAFPSIHITGTNGKTTCARAATEVLRGAGLRVGTYTSPHVASVRERFLYDGEPIGEDDFASVWEQVIPYLDAVDRSSDRPVTWFEAATALAFYWFAEKAVDIAVVEVGMGGTWDATNVIDASVAAISPIAVDHAVVLGSTPAEIAREKAGIIKPGAVVFLSEQEQAVADVLRARCDEVGAEMRAEGMAFAVERAALAVGGQALTVRLERDRYPELFLPMFGAHFAHDAVLGAAAARAMLGGAHLEEELLVEAFARIRVPGRLEVVSRRPLVVLDGAHNPAAARVLAGALPAAFTYERLIVVVSVMADKDARGILAPIVALADHVVVTKNESPRALEPDALAAIVRELGGDATIVANVSDALAVANERAGESDCVLVTGSLYTVAEARSRTTPEVNR